MSREPHIVVVGGEDHSRIGVLGALKSAGFQRVVSCTTVSLAGEHLRLPDLVVVVGPDVAALCSEARQAPVLAEVPLLAVVDAIPTAAASHALAEGADDVITAPPVVAIIGARSRALIKTGTATRSARALESLGQKTREIQEVISNAGEGQEGLRDALVIAAEAMGFDRASLVAHIEGSVQAYVIAATDDPTLSKFGLHMDNYPEVRTAIQTARPVMIDDAQSDPLLAEVASKVKEKGIRGVAVFPVRWARRSLGVVLFRRDAKGVDHIDTHRFDFARLFARQVAAQLGHSRVMESLREQTGRISRVSYEAERRLRTVDSLKEHFEAAADGVVVLDEEGRMLFVNHTAERITGFARDGLLGSPLVDLVPPHQRTGLQEVIDSVLTGTNLEAFDLDLSTTSGEPICASVTTSTVLSSSGAVILSFRDVTSERALEIELRKTKEFLEKLIDSTVDAIVAADTGGQIILFNQGAERIYGYHAEDVIGSISVGILYEAGVAQQVMRMLRSHSYGGVGRLEQTRREIVTKQGEKVPVNMTASIIYEDGREVATVGIFSDLRERIRIEQRLLQAQAKLQHTEKQAVVAELAGAAAHELNQPLTSILGYAQLIERQSEADAPHLRAVNVILREGDRMAEIVRKIGRITKFETKEYVGEATILDLDKSAASSSPELVIPDRELPEDHGDDDVTLHDGRRNRPDTEESRNSDETSKDASVRVEVTRLGHHLDVCEDLDGEEIDGDETLDELDLDEALDHEGDDPSSGEKQFR